MVFFHTKNDARRVKRCRIGGGTTKIGDLLGGSSEVATVALNRDGSATFGQTGKGAFIGPQNVGNANQERGIPEQPEA